MRTIHKPLTLLLIMLFAACKVQCVLASDIIFRNLTGTDGLSGLLVNTLYKDSRGYVWIGTDNGLDRFDGMRIRNFTFTGIGQTMKKRVSSVAVTASGRLFAGNGLGLWAEDGHGGTLSRRFDDKISFPVNALLTDGDVLYAGTDKGLYIIKGEELTVKRVDNNAWTASNRITDIIADKASRCLWLTTQDGLARYDMRRGTFILFRQASADTDNYFRCLAKVGTDVYVGTMTQGLLVFNTKDLHFAKGPSVGSNVVSDISCDGRDMVYVATDGNGVHYISHRLGKVVRSFRHTPGYANSISSNSVYSLLVDRRGMLWVGTYRTGLDYTLWHNDLFRLYSFLPDFTSANLTVNSVSIKGHERLIGTRDGLFFINELTHSVRRFSTPELTSNLILATVFYNGKYFVGTYGGGLMTLDPASQQLRSFGRGLSKGHVFCMRTDPRGRLWIGTDNGMYRYDGSTEKLQKFSSANSQLQEGSVYTITFDSTGKGWVGSERGLSIIEAAKGTIRADVFPEGFVNNDKIRCIYEDSRHNLFFVREKGNLFMSNLTMDKFGDVSLPFLRPDVDNSVLSVIEDRGRNLWIACSDGLFRMANIGSTAFDLYTFNDGLPSQTFTNNSALLDEHGLLWFGNTKGLVSVNPSVAADGKLRRLHRVLVTGVQVNGKETEEYSSLPNGDDDVTFFFSDMSFGAPGSAVYEYRLEGVDDDWRVAVARGQASYYNLKAGTYTFHVRTPGNASTETTVRITIRPLIAWWGWLLILTAVAALAYFLIRWRKGQHRAAEVVETSVLQTGHTKDASGDGAVTLKEQPKEKSGKVLLSDKECEMIKRRITVFMEKNRPYVNKNMKSVDLANGVGVPLNTLSFVLNKYMHMSFNDYVNDYRVREFKRKASGSTNSQLTLSALAEECGFGSHASFFRTFKKMTGITPNEFLHRLRHPS